MKSKLLINRNWSASGWPTSPPSPACVIAQKYFSVTLFLLDFQSRWCFKKNPLYSLSLCSESIFSLILILTPPSHFFLVWKEKLIILLCSGYFILHFCTWLSTAYKGDVIYSGMHILLWVCVLLTETRWNNFQLIYTSEVSWNKLLYVHCELHGRCIILSVLLLLFNS